MTGAQGVNAMNGAAPDASPKGAYRWNLGRRVRARRCVGQPGRGWQMVAAAAGRIALVLQSDHTAAERETAGGAERWDVDG